MFTDSIQPPYFVRWDHSRGANHDGTEVRATPAYRAAPAYRAGHRLGELNCFGDVGLARWIDRHPRSEIAVTSCGYQPLHPSEHRIGRIGNQDGGTLLDMLRRGRFRLTLRNIARHQPELGRIVRRVASEWNECTGGLPMLDCDGDLVLESPSMIRYTQASPLPLTTWQIRGGSTMHRYDVSPDAIEWESIPRQWFNPLHRVSRLHLEPAMESAGTIETLDAGDVISTGQFVPHRITGGDSITGGGGINVRLSIRHLDAASWSRCETVIGNQVLHRIAPCRLSVRRDGTIVSRGPVGWMKRQIGRVLIGRPTTEPFGTEDPDDEISFALDADQPNGLDRFDHPMHAPSVPADASPRRIPPVFVPDTSFSMSMTSR